MTSAAKGPLTAEDAADTGTVPRAPRPRRADAQAPATA